MKKGIFQKNFISAGLFFVLALSLVPIAILYGNEAQRNMVLFLCSLGSCAAGFAAIYVSAENSKNQQQLIKAIVDAAEELQKLRIAITDSGMTTNSAINTGFGLKIKLLRTESFHRARLRQSWRIKQNSIPAAGMHTRNLTPTRKRFMKSC